MLIFNYGAAPGLNGACLLQRRGLGGVEGHNPHNVAVVLSDSASAD